MEANNQWRLFASARLPRKVKIFRYLLCLIGFVYKNRIIVKTAFIALGNVTSLFPSYSHYAGPAAIQYFFQSFEEKHGTNKRANYCSCNHGNYCISHPCHSRIDLETTGRFIKRTKRRGQEIENRCGRCTGYTGQPYLEDGRSFLKQEDRRKTKYTSVRLMYLC